jgi:acetyl-CoA carboxylase biotin carboxylase subunit
VIKSVLIANRGEIAVRVIRTARRLGLRTVAVYSTIDAEAMHVRLADEAVALGAASARESYLDPGKIVAAAKATGAQAIHPGYGFLSENADFAEAVIAAGLVWIGPPASAIRAMGPKDAAKRLMAKAGVPVTPGYLGEDQSADRLQHEADAMGYPVLIKAVAGGGGKGMRRVDQSADFSEALASCRREALNSFGDDHVILETYVSRPRHIEVQVFADDHGNAVHLYERDCSLQRRHQKVIEEAPAPGMDAATRDAVCAAAVRAARAVNYRGAGTVEFIADASEGLRADRIWFMEMNTRLQVEHPVTEMITGLDLVEWQIRVASGEPLPLKQKDIRCDGWAMEARLYAENPATGFLPSTGPLTLFDLPEGSIRVDTGVEEGGEVSPFYDPMIAKLIAYGPDRQAAARTLAQACRDVRVWPVKTNAGFLARALSDPSFLAEDIDTGFIARRLDPLLAPEEPPSSAFDSAAAAFFKLARAKGGVGDPWDALEGFRVSAPSRRVIGVQYDEDRRWIDVVPDAPSPKTIMVAETAVVFIDGDAFGFVEPQPSDSGNETVQGDGAICSPMPGLIVSTPVQAGDQVVKGQTVVALESMKTEHGLAAPFDGVVDSVGVKVGDLVSEGAILVRLTKGA